MWCSVNNEAEEVMVFKPLILVFSTKCIFELSCCECCFIVVLQLYQGSSCILDFGILMCWFHFNSGMIKLWLVLSSAPSRCLSSDGETGSQAVLTKPCCMQLNLLAGLNLFVFTF